MGGTAKERPSAMAEFPEEFILAQSKDSEATEHRIS
jgi:hypothetical protein